MGLRIRESRATLNRKAWGSGRAATVREGLWRGGEVGMHLSGSVHGVGARTLDGLGSGIGGKSCCGSSGSTPFAV
jgi:hypothetical protein